MHPPRPCYGLGQLLRIRLRPPPFGPFLQKAGPSRRQRIQAFHNFQDRPRRASDSYSLSFTRIAVGAASPPALAASNPSTSSCHTSLACPSSPSPAASSSAWSAASSTRRSRRGAATDTTRWTHSMSTPVLGSASSSARPSARAVQLALRNPPASPFTPSYSPRFRCLAQWDCRCRRCCSRSLLLEDRVSALDLAQRTTKTGPTSWSSSPPSPSTAVVGATAAIQDCTRGPHHDREGRDLATMSRSPSRLKQAGARTRRSLQGLPLSRSWHLLAITFKATSSCFTDS
ncbi:hypothetical protein C8R45DRAFT_553800 [Mycena sanguinolenta]|nr:hypothetical protein C8R45DRAFT_553800 [Mycena sanguinolenta]